MREEHSLTIKGHSSLITSAARTAGSGALTKQ